MKRGFIIIWTILFIVISCVPVGATEKKVIRVGFANQAGITEKDENGNYTGYTIDYLNEIKKYTGWSYEYVEVEGTLNEQLTTLIQMLQNGEIDLLGAMTYNESLADIYDYPSYNYGEAYTALVVRSEAPRWVIDDSHDWNRIKIGTCPALENRVKELEKYADISGFTYELIDYSDIEEVLQALQDGEVDAMLQSDISLTGNLKAIAKFSPKDFYFATTKGNKELIRTLNHALSNIVLVNPYLKETLHDKYFNNIKEFVISKETKEYVKSLGEMWVLLFDGNAPVQYYNEKEKRQMEIRLVIWRK